MIPGPKILVRCQEIQNNGMIFKNEYNYKWRDVVAEFDHPESIATNRVNFQADPFANTYEFPRGSLNNKEIHFSVVSSNRPRVVYPLERVSIGFSILITEPDENNTYKPDTSERITPPRVLHAQNYLSQYNNLLSFLGKNK